LRPNQARARYGLGTGSVIGGGCDRCLVRGSMVARRRLAMNRWFLNTHREWLELIIAAVLLWLLMMVTIHELELRTVS
jgi:hypothetical protein